MTTDRDRRPKRPSWDTRMLMLARWWSQWSTCPRLEAGCVIADRRWVPVASGYNGAPRGVEHCTQRGCTLIGGHCTAVHAEQNALMHAAALGVSVSMTMVFVTHRPCIRCAYLLGQAGVASVTWAEDYDSDNLREEVMAYFKSRGILGWRVLLPPVRRGEIVHWR